MQKSPLRNTPCCANIVSYDSFGEGCKSFKNLNAFILKCYVLRCTKFLVTNVRIVHLINVFYIIILIIIINNNNNINYIII